MDIDELIKLLKEELIKVLGESYNDYQQETKQDIDAFLQASKIKLERWTNLLAAQDLTINEYEWLLQSQKDLMVLSALKKSGVSALRLGHLKNKIIKTILNTVVIAVL